jgi:8-oxo-dGTP pyrophosphatase MutT (NUDIX family)
MIMRDKRAITMTHDIRVLLDSLRSIAQEGLSYSRDIYDRERYKKLMNITSHEYKTITGIPESEIMASFLREQGSITPKIGTDAAVIDEEGKLLVLKRVDSQGWCLPGGWADVNESPFEAAARETLEEAGVKVEPTGYITIGCKNPSTVPEWTDAWVSQVNICISVKPVASGTKVTLSHEHTDYAWIQAVNEIDNWHIGHEAFVEQAFIAYQTNLIVPHR